MTSLDLKGYVVKYDPIPCGIDKGHIFEFNVPLYLDMFNLFFCWDYFVVELIFILRIRILKIFFAEFVACPTSPMT